jgi:phage tail tube protein FII
MGKARYISREIRIFIGFIHYSLYFRYSNSNIQIMRILLTLLALSVTLAAYSQKSTIRTNIPSANIFIDGKLVGQGEVSGIKIPRNQCITVQVSATGYLSQTKEYCKIKGMPQIEKTEYIELGVDDSFEASVQSDFANNDIIINPKSKDVPSVWKNAFRLISNYFDAMEVNDTDVYYLRTAWVVSTFKGYTIRTRVIYRLTRENPLEFSIKVVSERAEGQASPKEDEKFKPWSRILKRYAALIEEVQQRS